MNEYLIIYIVGCVAAVVLALLKVALHYFLEWVTKANVVQKNLRKIDPPPKTSFASKASGFALLLIFEAALSWINVAIVLFWQIPAMLLVTLREVFSATPERVKVLRFPLRNNPTMSPEAVWAHTFALGQVFGQRRPNVRELLESLDAVSRKATGFHPIVALDHLSSLKAVDGDMIGPTLEALKSPLRRAFFLGLPTESAERDEKRFWEYEEKRTALEKKFDPKGEREEYAPRPEAYVRELDALQWEYRGALWRRNGWSPEDFAVPNQERIS